MRCSLPEKGVERTFGGTLQRLHAFLNEDPATNDLLYDRKLWRPKRPKSRRSSVSGSRNWVTFFASVVQRAFATTGPYP